MASLTTTRLVPLFQGTPQVNPSWAFKQNAGCRGSWQTPLVKHADMADDTTRIGAQGLGK